LRGVAHTGSATPVHVFIHARAPIGGNLLSGVRNLSRVRDRLLLVLSPDDWWKFVESRIWQTVCDQSAMPNLPNFNKKASEDSKSPDFSKEVALTRE
jgi:hypothetical protein